MNANENHMLLGGHSSRCQTLTWPVTVPPLKLCVCFGESPASRLAQLDLENPALKQKQTPGRIVLPPLPALLFSLEDHRKETVIPDDSG